MSVKQEGIKYHFLRLWCDSSRDWTLLFKFLCLIAYIQIGLFNAFRPSCMNRASVFEWYKRFKEGREFVRGDERRGRRKEVNTPELIGQRLRIRVTMLRFYESSGRDSVGRGQHSSNRLRGISTWTIHRSTTPSSSQTIWPRLASR